VCRMVYIAHNIVKIFFAKVHDLALSAASVGAAPLGAARTEGAGHDAPPAKLTPWRSHSAWKARPICGRLRRLAAAADVSPAVR
jgi:hypothetical protein